MDGTIQLHQPDAGAFPQRVKVQLTRTEEFADWVFFLVTLDGLCLREAEVSGRALQFLRGFADICNPSFGQVAPFIGNCQTPLEMLLRTFPDKTIDRSREVLRGYSWVTICPQELGDRLGGESALLDSGAFTHVASLANGGYWLQATPTFNDHDQPAAERVFRIVAPVLPAGEPTDPTVWPDANRYKMVIEDASTVHNK